jgi:pimeloyl-ACP methyl ester carboxylesterase
MEFIPFSVSVPQTDLDDLHGRLTQTRWPDTIPGVGWERGVPVHYLEQLAEYWRTRFDWRAWEGKLNEYPQFTAEIDGQRVHFLHVRSTESSAMPLLLVHSWPGSIVEFMNLIPSLTDPRSHGADATDAFHVIVPSLPGFGFSAPLAATGWSSGRIARAFKELMRGLGYERYGVHGNDIGAGIASSMSPIDPERLAGVHVTSDPPTAVSFAMFSGDPAAAPGLTQAERERIERMKQVSADGSGYLQIQTTRPQTLAYALTDSPAGQLAWVVEKFKEWTDPGAEMPEDAVERDQLLANASLYWFTRSGGSAAHALYEAMHAQEWGEEGTAPVGWAVFGADGIVRKLMDPERKIEHWSEFERGGHFPAMEAPDLLVADLRKFFRALRSLNS